MQVIECIEGKSLLQKQNAEDFIKLLVNDISVSVNKTVVETQAQQRRRKTVILLSADDIKLLKDHLQRKARLSLKNLKDKYYGNWISLAETTLTSVKLFNRRRAEECEKLAENYVRFEIRGKLNRTVPVLLSTEHKHAIECILKFRREAGVSDRNRYIFGIPGGHTKAVSNTSGPVFSCTNLQMNAEPKFLPL